MITNKKITIAIDGYSSCGKSTLAKQLAQKLSYIYIDSGAMYRAVTLYAMQNNFIGKDFLKTNEFISVLDKINIRFELDKDNSPLTFLNDVCVEKKIRHINVSSLVSLISKISEVRKKMVSLQREIGKNKGIVMDGRDIGSVVFPDAEIKFFLTADIDERAKRRYCELQKANINVSFEEVKQNLSDRDNHDQNRKDSPLIVPADAIIIDNTNLTKQQQFQVAYKHVTDIINEG